MIKDVIATIQAPDTPISDPALSDFFYSEHFLENQYNAINTALGKKLMEIGSKINIQSFSAEEITEDLFYELTERLVTDQVQVFKQLQSIPSVKNETRRDLCRKVLIGKDYIDSNFTENLSIAHISQIAGLSEYHFFRLFKQMMGITPYKYILTVRLNTASKLLKSDFAVSEVAIAMGFADIFTFSKAFKKHFGVSPSSFSRL
jgi:transcriptional regulator GlxA family with amidase domain